MRRVGVQVLLCVWVAVSLTSVTGLDEEMNEMEKRAPLGFQGMRGKKADTYSDDNALVNDLAIHPNDVVDKRAPNMGFQGMRGKKLYRDDYGGMYELKRAPMGFQGMRGKKALEILNEGDFSATPFDKRAPSAGFMGVRGKKENDARYFVHGYDDDDEEDADVVGAAFLSELEKRAPTMGFQGMRGNKAPIASFFGVRGKKQPVSSSFFGMRGKKYPYEFRGKFVGVRGKKDHLNALAKFADSDIVNDSNVVNNNRQDLNLNHLLLLLSENQERNDDIPWIKRAGPNGFFGVRGKKEKNDN